jgi:hypothetical protein
VLLCEVKSKEKNREKCLELERDSNLRRKKVLLKGRWDGYGVKRRKRERSKIAA